jgi:hypothetical protein
MPSTTPNVSTSLVLASPGTPIDNFLLAVYDLADGGAGVPQLAAQTLDIGESGLGVGVGCGRCIGGHQALL